MALDANTLLHGAVVVIVGIIGWVVRKMEAESTALALAVKSLDLRAQLAEVRMATSDTKSELQAKSIEQFHEDLTDIRDNMVRRADLEALVTQINVARRPRPSRN